MHVVDVEEVMEIEEQQPDHEKAKLVKRIQELEAHIQDLEGRIRHLEQEHHTYSPAALSSPSHSAYHGPGHLGMFSVDDIFAEFRQHCPVSWQFFR